MLCDCSCHQKMSNSTCINENQNTNNNNNEDEVKFEENMLSLLFERSQVRIYYVSFCFCFLPSLNYFLFIYK